MLANISRIASGQFIAQLILVASLQIIQQSSAFLPNQPHKYNLEHMSLPKPLVAFGFSV
jgi:hypothetical protein